MGEDAWQVFRWVEDEEDHCGTLVGVGRIVRPDDAPQYWSVTEEIVGARFGEGQYIVFAEEAITDWKKPTDYTRRDPVFLDVVAETRYKAREPQEIEV